MSVVEKNIDCPMLLICRRATGIDCSGRDFDGNQPFICENWRGKQPCDFYKHLVSEANRKPKLKKKPRRLW